MSVSRTSKFDSLPPEQMIVVNRFCDQFEQLWRDHEEASLTAFLDSVQCVQEDTLAVLQIELVALDRQYRTKYDRETIALDRYASWCPCLTKQDLLSLERGTSTEMQGTLQSGQRIGDYVIHECIGRGGMGQVYRARHELMGREVAIKILLERSNKDAEARSRFEREVRSVAAMSHPNVLAAFDAREFGGMLCLVTEWIDGSNLSEIVAERGPLPVAEALDLIRQAARGLAYAHEKGIIHRDVKPSNLFLDQAGKLKVLDLGLAKLRIDLEDDSTRESITKPTHIMGTAEFLSPEQARSPDQVDVQSDVYSLGCTLYFLIAGQPPYSKESPLDTLLCHLHSEVPRLSRTANVDKVPASVCKLVQTMMAKDLSDRPPSMDDVVSLIEHLQGQSKSSVSTVRSTLVMTRYVAMFVAVAFVVVAIASVLLPSRTIKQSAADRLGVYFDGEMSYGLVSNFDVGLRVPSMIEVMVTPQRGTLPANVVTWTGQDSLVLFAGAGQKWGVACLRDGESILEVTSRSYDFGQTYRVAACLTESGLEIWVDGERAKTNQVIYPLFPSEPQLCFGGTPVGLLPKEQGTRFFHGTIHEFRLSQGLLPEPAQLSSRFALLESTVALFRLEEGIGKTTEDVSAESWNARLFDATWHDTAQQAE